MDNRSVIIVCKGNKEAQPAENCSSFVDRWSLRSKMIDKNPPGNLFIKDCLFHIAKCSGLVLLTLLMFHVSLGSKNEYPPSDLSTKHLLLVPYGKVGEAANGSGAV
ncbi:hypothetical protein L3X38_015726 [Prunus dulcis]|uniref:Uncharacterized protein n=1 Tax=Prunus dulcis TaxID=3755 RepID=A0AAD4Z8H7_PRUDU|nr:hypothetical protein L3X38_015726 [Prunus dulcis]